MVSRWRPFLQQMQPHWGWMLIGGLMGLGAVLSAVGLMALAGWFLSATAIAGLNSATAHLFNFFYPSIALRLLAVSRTLTRYMERVIAHDTTFRILESLRVWYYRKLEPLAPARLQQFRSGDILSRIVSDIDVLDQLYVRVFSPAVIAVVSMGGVCLVLGVFHLPIAITAFGWLLLCGFGLAWISSRLAHNTANQLPLDMSRLRTGIVENLQGLAEILVFGARAERLRAMEKHQQQLISTQQRLSRLSGFTDALAVVLAGMAQITVLLMGVPAVVAGSLQGVYLALLLLAVMASFEVVRPLPAAFHYLGQARQATDRLLEIIETTPAVTFPDTSASPIHNWDLVFEKVRFAYPQTGCRVLSNLNLRISAGERTAMLGRSGAGKSTVAHLVVRFWDPTSGTIRIGDTDIRQLSETDLRRHIVLVSQRAHLFHTTIRENLAVADPDADDQKMTKALEAARMGSFVRALPRGLDTLVGESGKLLSGGQIRRLAVARAILRDAPIWVLDEPTEGLDRITENALIDTLLELTASRTVLWITHRPAVLRQMDRVWMLNKGTVSAADKDYRAGD